MRLRAVSTWRNEPKPEIRQNEPNVLRMNSKLGDCALLAQLKHLGIAQDVHPMPHPSGRPAVPAVAHGEKMAVQGRKRAALFSWKRSAQLYLDEILRLPLSRV